MVQPSAFQSETPLELDRAGAAAKSSEICTDETRIDDRGVLRYASPRLIGGIDAANVRGGDCGVAVPHGAGYRARCRSECGR